MGVAFQRNLTNFVGIRIEIHLKIKTLTNDDQPYFIPANS